MHDFCWAKEPVDRPTFAGLKEILSKFHVNALEGIDGDVNEDEGEGDCEEENGTDHVLTLNEGAVRSTSISSSDEITDASDTSSGYDSAQQLFSPTHPSTNNSVPEIAFNFPIMNPFLFSALSVSIEQPNESESNRPDEICL